jgi:hypothetical protein
LSPFTSDSLDVVEDFRVAISDSRFDLLFSVSVSALADFTSFYY